MNPSQEDTVVSLQQLRDEDLAAMLKRAQAQMIEVVEHASYPPMHYLTLTDPHPALKAFLIHPSRGFIDSRMGGQSGNPLSGTYLLVEDVLPDFKRRFGHAVTMLNEGRPTPMADVDEVLGAARATQNGMAG